MAVRYQSAPESDTDKARSTARRVALPLCPSCPRRSLGTCANEIAPMRMDHGSNGSIFFSVVNDILLSQRCRTNDFELVPTGNSFWMTSRKVHEGKPGSTWNKSPEVDQLENEQKIFSKIGKIGDEDQMAKWPNSNISKLEYCTFGSLSHSKHLLVSYMYICISNNLELAGKWGCWWVVPWDEVGECAEGWDAFFLHVVLNQLFELTNLLGDACHVQKNDVK